MGAVRKRTLNIDEGKLERARRILSQPTDTATIHAALDWVIESQAMVDDLLAVAGKGKGLLRSARTTSAKRRP